jgi:transcriptional regulator of nitric oxide reductase
LSCISAEIWRRLAIVFLSLFLSCVSAAATDLSVASQFFAAEGAVTIEQAQGNPPAAAVRAGDGRLLGYAFSTREVSGSVGYSGRPLDIVAAITTEGIIAGARIVAHEEPILVIGIPREALAAYVANFQGYDLRASNDVRTLGGAAARGPQAVAGATVTSTVIRDAIIRSGRAVLRTRAVEHGQHVRLDRETRRTASWSDLVADGAVRRYRVTRGEAARLLGGKDAEPDQLFIELWVALATPAAIGENLIGQRSYESELAKLGPDDDLILIGASGLYSFKGTEWRRSGVFERIEIVQGDHTIRLLAENHISLDRLRAEGAPELREIGLFRIPRATGFDATAPFRLDLTIAPPGGAAGTAMRAVVPFDYAIPDQYRLRPSAAEQAAQPAAAPEPVASAPLWQDIWRARSIQIAVLLLMLAGLGSILVFQNAVASRRRFYVGLRASYLVVTFVFLGLIANAQLSIVNVITFVHALLSGFRWELFLLDPLVFMLWSFVAASMLFWGRGVFCGWLCPFGALQELTNMVAQRLGVKQVDIPFGLHERLWMVKYVLFLIIVAVSLNSIMAAFGLAEIEPFKTAITMKFMRDWPFVSYAVTLLVIGIFVERFFCRYLCTLGAALAIPARMRMFEWLKRYRECGAECQVCARRCTVQAIHPLGQINPNECIYCLKCQANYFDDTICLHLKKRAERRRPAPPPAGSAPQTRSPGIVPGPQPSGGSRAN